MCRSRRRRCRISDTVPDRTAHRRTMVTIARRKVLAGLGSAALACPLAARAQDAKAPLVGPVVGLLGGMSFEGAYAAPIVAIRRGLQERGFVEGQDVRLEYRSANGRYDRLP